MRVNPIAPPAFSINDIDALCQQYLTILYSNQRQKSTKSVPKSQISATYGEILYQSVNQLITSLSLTEQDVFVDLGSGKGQIVVQVFLKSLVKAAYGIEFLPDLHATALAIGERIQHDLPDFFHGPRNLGFLLGSFLDTSFATATVVLINSTCFPQILLNQLGLIIEKTPSIHTVLSLRPIHTLQRLVFLKALRIECSWDSALCYFYGARR
jgi:hypothetical protein